MTPTSRLVTSGLGVRQLGRVFQALTRVERWARVSTGTVFILIGVDFVATRIVGFDL